MGRAPCCDKNGLKKGPWTPEEDQKLVDYVQKHGHGSWRTLPKNAGLQRCGKSCRLRWANYLRPDIKRGRFSFEEEETIIQLHSVLGNKWSTIAARLPGRTDNEIKNYWNTHIRKRLLKSGIDPVTHTPRLDLLDLSSILRSSICNSPQLMNISGLLGLQSLVNPDLMRLLNTLVTCQRGRQDYSLQNLQDNQVSKPQNQNHQFSSFQPNHQMQSSNHQQTPLLAASSTAAFAQFLNEAQQVLQGNEQSSSINLDSVNSQHTMRQNHNVGFTSNSTENVVHFQSNQDYGSDQVFINSLPGNSNFQLNNYINQDSFGLNSVLSTPTSSQTPMNSSNATEDERDSYCSDFLQFQIPDMLDINGFM
ncbi:hypothetical protein C5167_009189 [Papaver somniferum]|uniref:Uncharacterized protein n=1 Tax=Papaver somniferum TaxID=3469 RepID=A0A4Y7K0L1_PAPSO|nr:transcription factor MYB41-like [Papaver somniferum]RZC65498.1 hypothetical protein C5167_009189 [Papaver somniferum]